MSGITNLKTLEGPFWTSSIQAYMDCLIYCSDGILVSSQVQLAVASEWLRELLSEIQDTEENRIKTIILPFISSKLMKQVLDLISGGSPVLHDEEIPQLVEIFSLLGCTGDMLKEPLPLGESSASESVPINTEFHVLVHQLDSDRSIDTVLQQMQDILKSRRERMEEIEKNQELLEKLNVDLEITGTLKKEPTQEVDSDDFIVSDDEISDYEGASGGGYKRKRSSKFDLQLFEDKLMKLGESTASRGGASVDCGSCDRAVPVPLLKSVSDRINHFKKNHFNKCQKRVIAWGEGDDETEIKDDETDDLIEVYSAQKAVRNADSQKVKTTGRMKAELPPIETIQSFLEALGSAKVVNSGRQIKCGLCHNKLKVHPDRPIMGNLRYFERTHLVRCPVKLKISGKPKELVSENFVPGRTSTSRVLKSITMFDNNKASLVTKLMALDPEGSPAKRRGRPRKDKENTKEEEEEGDDEEYEQDKSELPKKDQYISKRKQCLAASRICFDCSVIFVSGAEAETHYKKEHPNKSKPFYCLACQEEFANYENVMSHLEMEHNYKDSYSCTFCDKTGFLTQSKLNKHMLKKHPEEENAHHCSMCSKGFTTFQALRLHQKMHETKQDDNIKIMGAKQTKEAMTEAFTCRFCQECIMYGKELDQHIRDEHPAKTEDPYTCQFCITTTKSFKIFYYYQLHLRDHGLFIDYVCRFCKITHLNRSKFNEHFKTLHPHEIPNECPWPDCDKLFKKKQMLNDHITLHRVKEGDVTKDMMNTCPECGKVFYSKSKLECHLKVVHDGKGLNTPEWNKKRRLNCNICNQSFSTKDLLQGHVRKHENNPCFMCDHCGKGFYRKVRLMVHTRAVHFGQKNYECTVCLKRFMDNYKLKRHMKTHTSGRNPVQPAQQPQQLQLTDDAADQSSIAVTAGGHQDGITAAITAGEIAVESEEGQAVAIVQVPHSAVSYELAASNTAYIRNFKKMSDGGQEETIQTILHITPPVAKKSSAPSIIRFETSETGEDQNPVDFTQQATAQRFIISTEFMPTS